MACYRLQQATLMVHHVAAPPDCPDASLRSDGYRAVLPECSWACGPKEQLSIVQSAQHAALPASHQVPTNT
ncbi:hypothetical protein WJX72_004452 [[Myrmecia] bisecta]|uniref:Uncharacterized protein n=1 Tax=[Myrmecia] bisecta TaxID=41462 RepID=A0AAW1PSR6_9CHLO